MQNEPNLIINTKKCSKCYEIRDISLFHRDKSKKDGYDSSCKLCEKLRGKALYDLAKENNKCVEKGCTDSPHENTTRCFVHREKDRWRHIKWRFGLTKEQWEAKLIEQDNKCSACDVLFLSDSKICVDHCHVTNNIRGLIHDDCNVGLGRAKDSIEILRNWITYLEKHQPIQ
jgi:hypothetical protein